ncbi:hypothetical protein HJC23_006617 [Cyclotella cryptica]|uniref:C-CAP/cofactor C-like domain-containing protein n=1 Tax=Cyclotella cryptica TaxID=29204 RepID=A0ABD3QX19_9STRA|eukprot:CCRYP_001017-RA/>CCRYP_001017-RA protein AED:0.25 eAED:0.25 QI:212/-1/1/1/-1/1/1/195/463
MTAATKDVTKQGESPNHTANASTNKEDVLHFWFNFRNLCNAFHCSIDALLLPSLDDASKVTFDGASRVESTPVRDWSDEMKNQVRCHYATTSKRNEGRLRLDAILKQVRLLQQHVLSSSSSMNMANTGSSSSSSGNVVLDAMLSQSMPDLSLTDIRLLSAEMEKILNRIDEARDIICPKEKFVFRRYRRALEELSRNASDGESRPGAILEGLKKHAVTEKEKQQHEQEKLALGFRGVIENKSNCIIEILSDGSLTLRDEADPHEHWKFYAIPRPYPASPSSDLAPEKSTPPEGPSSYLLQNLTDTTVILHPELQSLHIQNIHHCKIYSVVLGPVHVTNCHDSTIRCSAYQLRVHDSKNVKFGVWVRSGPIIEDCTAMVFAGDFYHTGGSKESEWRLGRNMYGDVKDFNWLRSLRKSPNFVLMDEEQVLKNADGDSKVTKVVDRDARGDDITLVVGEEDSDDEL